MPYFCYLCTFFLGFSPFFVLCCRVLFEIRTHRQLKTDTLMHTHITHRQINKIYDFYHFKFFVLFCYYCLQNRFEWERNVRVFFLFILFFGFYIIILLLFRSFNSMDYCYYSKIYSIIYERFFFWFLQLFSF